MVQKGEVEVKKALSVLEGRLQIVGLEVTTEGKRIRSGTRSERNGERSRFQGLKYPKTAGAKLSDGQRED